MEHKMISVIIPLPQFNDYIREAIPYYEKLDYPNFEIIILPDEEQTETLSDKLNIRVIPSGKVGPAEKRDMGAEAAKGEILAFIDDDAFPAEDWLMNAAKFFEREEFEGNVGAVGGPAVTPDSDGFWQKVSGDVYASAFVSAQNRRRYVPVYKIVEDYDIPTVNLIMRKDIFIDIGGFDSTFYPGEDTKLCLEVKRRGYKMYYDPGVLVYHHRRKMFWTHFKQITNYAWHRGYFVKKYPETSRKPAYFVPSLFVLGLIVGGILSIFSPVIAWIYLGVMGVYLLLNLIFSFHPNPLRYFWTFIGTIMSHVAYGIFFIKGLFTNNIKR